MKNPLSKKLRPEISNLLRNFSIKKRVHFFATEIKLLKMCSKFS